MITWKKAASALLIASLLSSSMAPMAMAASKTKVGKISLTIDSDIRTGREGGDVEVTPTGDNTDRYYVDSWEVTNDTAIPGPGPIRLRLISSLGWRMKRNIILQALRPAASS